MSKPYIVHLVDALNNLAPGCQFVIRGDSYDGIEWHSTDIAKPQEDEVVREIDRLQEVYNLTEYQRLREKEYPPITDYLDAVVKGDEEQIQAYINACLAVKAKYPKAV